MRVIENIDNLASYPSELNEGDKENYREALKLVYTKLLPIRAYSDKTEAYFFKHLWPVTPSNNDVPDLICYYHGRGKSGLPIKKEVGRKAFLLSLQQVLSYDATNFAYTLCLITAVSANPDIVMIDQILQEARLHYPAQDEILYAVKIDIDEIFAHSDKLQTNRETIEYLQTWLETSRNMTVSNCVVKEKVENSLELRIKELEENETRENRYWEDAFVAESSKPIRHKSDIIYFNFWGNRFDELRTAAEKSRRKSDEQNKILDQKANCKALEDWFVIRYKSLFMGSQLDAEHAFETTRTFLTDLFKDFIPRLCRKYQSPSVSLVSDIADWARKVFQCSQNAHMTADDYVHSSLGDNSNGKILGQELSHLSFYHQQTCQYTNTMALAACRELSVKNHLNYHDCILYNFWFEQYSSLFQAAKQKLIKTEEERQMVDLLENYRNFDHRYSQLVHLLDFCILNSKEYLHLKKELSGWLYSLAGDYAQRLLSSGANNKKALLLAMETWVTCSWLAIMVALDHLNNQAVEASWSDDKITTKESDQITTTINRHILVADFCAHDLDAIRKEFCRNVEDSLSEESGNNVVGQDSTISDNILEENPTVSGNGSTRKVKYFTKDFRPINVEIIYTFIKNQEATDLSQDDFQNAIDFADFSLLYEDAKRKHCEDYPACIIMKLKDLFEGEWYTAACKSIGKDKSRVSGYHHENGKMAKIHSYFPSKLT